MSLPLNSLDCPFGEYVVPALPSAPRKLSLVVPTYQEAGNIKCFLTAVCGVLDRQVPGGYEVIVVDDDSADGTWLSVREIMPAHPAVRLMRRKSERGLASAVFRGFQMARGDVLGTINADFQHPPEVLGCLIERMEEADIAVASRYCKGGGIGDWPEERLMLSRAAIHTGRLVLPRVFAGLTDPLSGFYLFRRHVISGVALSPIGFKSLIEILARGRAEKIVECPYEMRARCCGKSKATFESSLDFLRQLRRLQTAHAA